MGLYKVYSIFKTFQDILSVLLPVLEKIVQRDIDGDGRIGDTPTVKRTF